MYSYKLSALLPRSKETAFLYPISRRFFLRRLARGKINEKLTTHTPSLKPIPFIFWGKLSLTITGMFAFSARKSPLSLLIHESVQPFVLLDSQSITPHG